MAQASCTPEAASPESGGRYIVRLAAQPHGRARALAEITEIGGHVLATQTTLNTAVFTADPRSAAAAVHLPGVVAVVPDGRAKAQSLGFDWRSQSGSMTNVSRATAAHNVWARASPAPASTSR